MTDRFANMYWSSDYVTGIESLKTQSNISVNQLHELRQLVFSYMNYYHSNSQFLSTLALETSQSSFKILKDQHPVGLQIGTQVPLETKTKQLFKRSVSLTHKKLEQVKSIDGASDQKLQELVTMDVPLTMYVKDMGAESVNLLSLASSIDREVLENINDFIRHHEPFIRTNIDRLDDLVNDYIATYSDIERLKSEYNDCKRAKEFADNEAAAKLAKEQDDPDSSISSIPEEPVNTSFNDSEGSATLKDDSDNEIEDDGNQFEFPLLMGPTKIKSYKELAAFLVDMMSRVESTKRTFPLPGQKLEIFSSDQLCKFLVYRRPFKLNPTRLNLERFGQGLLDLKLIVATSLIGGKKFKSENMWFEWTELAEFVSGYKAEEEKSKTSSPLSTPTKKRLIDERTAKQMNEMANNTQKKFNDMFKSMKLSIMNTNYEEKLIKLEQDYNENFYDLHELKYLLDTEINEKAQYFEKFEKMKIGLIYQSLTKLLEITYNFSLDSTTRLHKFASTLINEINNPINYQNDYKRLLDIFSTGIYSPSILSPENFQNHHYSTTQANNNFQNLKLQFNLYKDIPLQLQMRQTDKDILLLSFTSLPFFIYQFVKVIEQKEDKLNDLKDAWISPINPQSYWKIKEQIIETVNTTSIDNVTISNENVIQQTMIESIIELLAKQEPSMLINFFKNWLLEIADSLIPCLVYDSLIHIYKQDELKSTVMEIIKVLSTIPRSNVSSLLFILEHISLVFSLNQIPSFGLSDEIPNELKSPIDKDSFIKVAESLNTMDSIGAIPFLHLILRPSPIKSAGGLKPPVAIYNLLLKDLLNLDVRCELFNNLVTNEKNVLEKKQQEKNNLGLQKKTIPPSPRRPMPNSVSMNTPMALSASESFSLRPFHTKVTPAPTPSASPVHLSREIFDSRSALATPLQPRERSSSGSFLAPSIDIEFAK